MAGRRATTKTAPPAQLPHSRQRAHRYRGEIPTNQPQLPCQCCLVDYLGGFAVVGKQQVRGTSIFPLAASSINRKQSKTGPTTTLGRGRASSSEHSRQPPAEKPMASQQWRYKTAGAVTPASPKRREPQIISLHRGGAAERPNAKDGRTPPHASPRRRDESERGGAGCVRE